MKTHFPNNRKQSIISKWRNGYRNIRNCGRMFYFLIDQKEYKFYIERDKEFRKMILSMIISFIIWIPISYFTPYEDESSKILVLMISFLLLKHIRKVMIPTLKLNEKEIYFRDLRIKWEEVDKVKTDIDNEKDKSLRYKMRIIISNKKGEVWEKYLGRVWLGEYLVITNYIRTFKKKYRKPYIYKKI